MAYSDFSFDDLTHQFGVRYESGLLTADAVPIAPSAWLTESLRIGQRRGFSSEKSRSERLVSPVLLELAERNQDRFTVQSGVMLDVDVARGLRGECDFVLSYGAIQDFITAPIFCVTEAKKQDMDWGMTQCAAQLVGAWRFNEEQQLRLPFLYGSATTGVEWRLLRFDGHVITIDPTRHYITELPRLLGALQAIVGNTTPSATTTTT
ncbi:MAG: hypothetical protein H7330_10965 [Hymenobacteraceae bacterium]|nr:hypothetical protein [Hymenobacteraceae bacterium]